MPGVTAPGVEAPLRAERERAESVPLEEHWMFKCQRAMKNDIAAVHLDQGPLTSGPRSGSEPRHWVMKTQTRIQT